uniref:Uncharacterized protein n=1 Tax=Rhizophora mucronata TaxID=61149 RepID=A0A2P2IPJ6_RHIMU
MTAKLSNARRTIRTFEMQKALMRLHSSNWSCNGPINILTKKAFSSNNTNKKCL